MTSFNVQPARLVFPKPKYVMVPSTVMTKVTSRIVSVNLRQYDFKCTKN